MSLNTRGKAHPHQYTSFCVVFLLFTTNFLLLLLVVTFTSKSVIKRFGKADYNKTTISHLSSLHLLTNKHCTLSELSFSSLLPTRPSLQLHRKTVWRIRPPVTPVPHRTTGFWAAPPCSSMVLGRSSRTKTTTTHVRQKSPHALTGCSTDYTPVLQAE